MFAVYRIHDAHGRLLYVGRSLDPFRRLKNHKETSTFFTDAASISLAWFSRYEDATKAEQSAILDEQPLFNVHGKTAPKNVCPAPPSVLSERELRRREKARMRQRRRRAKAKEVASDCVDREDKSASCEELIRLAKQYGVHVRTIRRWKRDGVILN